MNRTAKKCLIASGVLHGTLAVTLLLVSGFADADRKDSASGDFAFKEITIVQAPVAEAASNPSADTGKVVKQVVQASTSALRLPSAPSATREPFKLVPYVRDSHPVIKTERNDGPNVRESVDAAVGAIVNRASSRVDMNFTGGEGASARPERS